MQRQARLVCGVAPLDHCDDAHRPNRHHRDDRYDGAGRSRRPGKRSNRADARVRISANRVRDRAGPSDPRVRITSRCIVRLAIHEHLARRAVADIRPTLFELVEAFRRRVVDALVERDRRNMLHAVVLDQQDQIGFLDQCECTFGLDDAIHVLACRDDPVLRHEEDDPVGARDRERCRYRRKRFELRHWAGIDGRHRRQRLDDARQALAL